MWEELGLGDEAAAAGDAWHSLVYSDTPARSGSKGCWMQACGDVKQHQVTVRRPLVAPIHSAHRAGAPCSRFAREPWVCMAASQACASMGA